jgi:Lrp/AsnC family transcriptional regulator, regulator for asnA, asnC and gidA
VLAAGCGTGNDRPVATTPDPDRERGAERRRRGREPMLDDVDRSIIEQLQRDGRMPYTRLGSLVGLSEAAVRQRVQRLVDADVIDIVAVSNPLKLGMRRMAMIGVRTEGPSSEVAEQLETFRDIEYLAVTAGSFDLLAEVVVGDDLALLDLTNRIRAVPGVVATETFIYLDLVKQTFAWGAH